MSAHEGTGAVDAAPVLIAGAGPAGMTLALGLARFGVRSHILDAELGAYTQGSRSICTQNQTLEILERLGCGRTTGDEGVSWTTGRTYYRDTELFSVRLPGQAGAVYPPFVNISQARVEAIMLDRLLAEPLIQVSWATNVIGVRQDADGITLTVEPSEGAPEGEGLRGELTAAYAVGCDGSRSAVRRALGCGFPGHSFGDRFLITDVRIPDDGKPLPLPTDERRFYFDPPFNRGRQVLIHPCPDRTWRIDWQVPDTVDLDAEERSGGLDRRVRSIIGDRDHELVWHSVYRFHQRIATAFRVGRGFLAGDAAHIMSPFGARGMNSGIADTDNLAWKLALVVQGRASEALLDSYEAERRAACERNLAVTGATMAFMVPSSRARRVRRNAILRASPRVAALRRRVDSGKLAQPFVYADSPIVAPAPPGTPVPVEGVAPVPGAALPDAPCTVPGRPEVTRLRELVGPEFVGLWFAPDAAGAAPLSPLSLLSPLSSPPARLYAVGTVTGLVEGGAAGAGLPVIPDPDGVIAAVLGAAPGQLVVVRPDGHLAASVRGAGPAAFGRLVEQGVGGLGAVSRVGANAEVG